jgi:hypothetical protein
MPSTRFVVLPAALLLATAAPAAADGAHPHYLEALTEAIDDGKNPDDHPPIDANVSHKNRLHEILALIESADRDLAVDEDDKKALGWRARAQKDTADAHAFVLAAVNNDQPGR